MARILLIDDEEVVRVGMRRALTAFGHEVLEAAGGREGLRILTEQGVDLVLTDINMPDTDGIETIIAIRERGLDLPVIAMSGGGRMPKEVLLDSAHVLGALVCLAKPFDVRDLQAALGAALGTDGRVH